MRCTAGSAPGGPPSVDVGELESALVEALDQIGVLVSEHRKHAEAALAHDLGPLGVLDLAGVCTCLLYTSRCV